MKIKRLLCITLVALMLLSTASIALAQNETKGSRTINIPMTVRDYYTSILVGDLQLREGEMISLSVIGRLSPPDTWQYRFNLISENHFFGGGTGPQTWRIPETDTYSIYIGIEPLSQEPVEIRFTVVITITDPPEIIRVPVTIQASSYTYYVPVHRMNLNAGDILEARFEALNMSPTYTLMLDPYDISRVSTGPRTWNITSSGEYTVYLKITFPGPLIPSHVDGTVALEYYAAD